MVLRSDELQLSRGESVGDTALVLSRHVAAVGVRTGPDAVLEELAAQASIPVFNMLTAGHHPVPGAGRPADAARGVRPPGGPAARLRRRRQQRRALAGAPRARSPASRSSCLADRLRARADRRRRARRRPGRGGRRRARGLHRRVGVDGRRGHRRRAAARPRALPDRRRAARPRRARRHRAALPAGPPRRGDHRRGPLRRPRSASGTRPRTAGTRRRRCWSGSSPAWRRPMARTRVAPWPSPGRPAAPPPSPTRRPTTSRSCATA